MCHMCAAFLVIGDGVARKTGKIFRRGPSTSLVRIYVGRDPETRRRKYIGKSNYGGLRGAHAHLNHMLTAQDLGRNMRTARNPRP